MLAREVQCRRRRPGEERSASERGERRRELAMSALAVSAPLTPASSDEANPRTSSSRLQNSRVMATSSCFCSADDPPFHLAGEGFEGEPGALRALSVAVRRSYD